MNNRSRLRGSWNSADATKVWILLRRLILLVLSGKDLRHSCGADTLVLHPFQVLGRPLEWLLAHVPSDHSLDDQDILRPKPPHLSHLYQIDHADSESKDRRLAITNKQYTSRDKSLPTMSYAEAAAKGPKQSPEEVSR